MRSGLRGRLKCSRKEHQMNESMGTLLMELSVVKFFFAFIFHLKKTIVIHVHFKPFIFSLFVQRQFIYS
jgi:hypothetical protein